MDGEEEGYLDFDEDEIDETSDHVLTAVTCSEVVVDDNVEDDEEILRLRNEEVERRRKKLELEESKQLAKDAEIESKKRRKFEKEVKAIFENLDSTFTFKPLNSFERKIIHDMATKTNFTTKQLIIIYKKLIISKAPFNAIDELNEQLDNIHVDAKVQLKGCENN